jgi:hypothetical protein
MGVAVFQHSAMLPTRAVRADGHALASGDGCF